MIKKLLMGFTCFLFFVSCRKNAVVAADPPITQLYPLTAGNKWVYIDSFFDFDGTYYGNDTFYLKTATTITQNNVIYTPITDEYDEPIFTLRSDDSSAFILEPAGEALFFTWPFPINQPILSNSYFNSALKSDIYTTKITTTNYPSYKIIITQNDGYVTGYKQEEYYFAVGIGIIKGQIKYKNSDGSLFTSDSFIMLGYAVN